MEQENCSTKCRKYKHLNESERYKIEGFLQAKKSVKEIAKILGRNRSTVYREINRGKITRIQHDLSEKTQYRANVGQKRYRENGKNKERSLKIGKDRKLEEYIRKKILKERYSPDAVIGEIKRKGLKFKGMICTKTLYNYIDAGIFSGITSENLWEKRKRQTRKYRMVRRVSLTNKMARRITERPQEANNRLEYGHWEGDCVKGAQGTKATLLTLTERKTLEEIIIKLENGTQKEIQKVFDNLERKYGALFKLKFKTITFDNGAEFLNWKTLELSVLEQNTRRMTVYFAHSYSAWERGSNENVNKIIRRFIPKGKNIADFNKNEIKKVERWINNYPRKLFGYRSTKEMIKEQLQSNSAFGVDNVAL
jgi:transposase, IS30 family